ncbi:MAG: amidohydrolase family protein [Terriglobales bacterium]
MSLGAIDVLFHPTSRSRSEACHPAPVSDHEMDHLGVACALVSQCKKWSCERQWMCVDTRLEDVLRYIEGSSRYLGLAGYNPFDIADSLREIEFAVTALQFRGVYLHAASFGLPLTDERMYPLFAKAAELGVSALVQVDSGERINARHELDRLAKDFPELTVVLAQPRPSAAEMMAIAGDCENACFALDAGALAYLAQQSSAGALTGGPGHTLFFHSEVFEQRCMWGSNGMEWFKALRACDPLPLTPDARLNFLRYNAARAFNLEHTPSRRTPDSIPHELMIAER